MCAKPMNPNAAADPNSGIFGLTYTEEEAALVLIPVPWEATTSYGGGTVNGPAAILRASHQLDLFDLDIDKPYEAGIVLLPESRGVRNWSIEAKVAADKAREDDSRALELVNHLGQRVNDWVKSESKRVLDSGKILGVVGGDHSVPFGALQALAEKHPHGFGILHFDAHSDTRNAYEGFQWSHASIMHNVLEKIPATKKIVQVGIRDFCEEEFEYLKSKGERAKVYFDSVLAHRKLSGESWGKIAQEIVSHLPQEVWVSFDIDGLDPRFCPHTGTPVPGGLDFQEVCYVLKELVKSGRKIIGFDLNEVAPPPEFPESEDEWDANVGMRILYKLCGWTLASQGLRDIRSQG